MDRVFWIGFSFLFPFWVPSFLFCFLRWIEFESFSILFFFPLMKWFCGVLFLLVNISFVHHLGVSAQVPPAAVNALGELYNSTNGPKWVHNDNWMSSYSPCDEDNGWYGIDCNSGQISGVSLGFNGLDGTLSSSIFTDIPNLPYLYLLYNSLSGTIPDSIGYTNIYYYIYLDHNQLTGTLPDTFVAQPPNTNGLDTKDGHFPDLKLYNNQLTGTLPPSFSIVNEYGNFDLYRNNILCPFPDYCDYRCGDMPPTC